MVVFPHSMTEQPNLCVQIGLHKAGTTTLNNEFYRKHSGITHLGKTYRGPTDPIRIMMKEISFVPQATFDFEKYRRIFHEEVRPHLGPDKLVTLNDPCLSHGSGVEHSIVAERILDIMGQVKILIILRRQDEFLRSFYFQRIGTHNSTLAFDDWLRESFVFARPAPFSMIDYYNLIAPFVTRFGRDRVGVFLFEEFQSDCDAFADKLSAFLEVDTEESRRLLSSRARNERMTRLHLLARKRPMLHRMTRAVRDHAPKPVVDRLRWLANRSGRAHAEFPPELAKRLREYIGASNAQLAQEFDLPLEQTGYPMPLEPLG
jgi:hypothetical protein